MGLIHRPALAAPRAGREVVIDELQSRTALEPLRDAWERLFAAVPAATPFQSAEWLLPWIDHFHAAGGGQLLVLVARRGQELVGVAPLRIAETPAGRTLSFIGHGISDYAGFLIAPGCENAVAAAFLARLAARRATFDLCDLDQVPPGDPLHGAPVPDEFVEESTDRQVCPEVPLPRTSAELSARLSSAFAKKIRSYVRRLAREPGFAFDRADERSFDELIDAFFSLHTARWRTRDQPGVLAEDSVRAFHRTAARGLLARGRLRLHAVRARGRVVAVVYAFGHGKRVYSYLSGFHPELAPLCCATVALWRAMMEAIDDGFEVYDYLRGAEPYKYRWGARDRWNRRRVLRARLTAV